jgi:carboxyl-terminal processing protease
MGKLSERFRVNPWPLLIIVFLLGAVSVKLYYDYRRSQELKLSAMRWDKLMLILSQVDANYVDTVDYRGVTEEAIPYILQKLDPHSLYLSPKELKSADEQLQGNFDGIGVQFNIPNDTAVVINVIAGGPSERAGILSGDRLVKVDGKVVAGIKMDQDSLVSKLRGKSGSVVNVEVMRVGVKNLISFDIKRDKIPVKSLDVSYMINDTTGYIKLSKFTKTSYMEFVSALSKLRSEGMKSLIFDLRNNSGGYFDQALLMANEFLNKGDLIVYMQGRHRPRQDFYADNNGKYRDISIKVLIDEGSASSSEIFAGAIQDNDRGTIIGRRSFGKGLVQEPIYFSDNSGIRLTVARFYTPTGRSIQKPYSDNYREDIIERFRHGEMLNADSIKVNDSLRYTTPKGKTVYGGGGITPDIFVPIDTTGVGNFFVKVSNAGLTFRFSARMADEYRQTLNKISTLSGLYDFFSGVNFDNKFIDYASKNGVVAGKGEWDESKDLILNHIKAFVGRYTPLDDNAFYPILLEKDNAVIVAIGQ